MVRVLMTGAAGNTGSKVLRRLLNDGDISEVIALTNLNDLEPDLANDSRVRQVKCNLDDVATWGQHVTPEHVLVETANIRHGATLLPHIENLRMQRAFCVTTTGVFSKYHSYSRLYREIEDRYRSSPVEITILRPSMIYGNRRDHNMHRLIDFLAKTPVFPVFGGGHYLMQPVYVGDLAWGISEAVIGDIKGEFNLAGAMFISYREVIETIIRENKTPTLLVSVNHSISAAIVKMLERVPGFPVSHEQVMRLVEDKVFDITPAQSQFGYEPVDFETGIRRQLAELHKR